MLQEIKERGRKAVTARMDLEPVRIIWTQGDVTGAENLLIRRERQISLAPSDPAVLRTEEETAAILLDFGCEIHGGIRLLAWQGDPEQGIKVRIRFGESAAEAMSEIGGPQNATNDHAARDFVTNIGKMSMNSLGETGFRFVRIDVLEKGTLVLKSVMAELVYKEVPYRGRFKCNDELLNQIWMTGAYTMHLNMQEYIWDGIKRDRLVWIADMHPEIKTVMAVFGEDDSVKNSLDFIRKETPLPGWMNQIATYTMWYVIILYDWYLYTGDKAWIYEQREYLKGILTQMQGLIGEDGRYLLDKFQCFVDWPSCDKPDVVDSGMKAIHSMALERLDGLLAVIQEQESEVNGENGAYRELDRCREDCRREREVLCSHQKDYQDSKSAAALCALAGLADGKKVNEEVLGVRGAEGISTYMGYYILTAMARSGNMNGALACVRDYWGGMLSLGATTFWEDFDIAWLENAAPIDRLPREGEIDVHGTYGGYCYVGYRHSLCHGWASGPTSWLTEQVLGVTILEPGCRRLGISPELGELEWAEGVFPTPLGDVAIRVWKNQAGESLWEAEAPDGIVIEGA